VTSVNSGYSFRHVLGPTAAGHTTVTYLVENFGHSTRDEWLERIQAQEIRLDEAIATGDEVLRPGGILTWNRPGWIEEVVPTDYRILYCDEVLLAVDKGMT